MQSLFYSIWNYPQTSSLWMSLQFSNWSWLIDLFSIIKVLSYNHVNTFSGNTAEEILHYIGLIAVLVDECQYPWAVLYHESCGLLYHCHRFDKKNNHALYYPIPIWLFPQILKQIICKLKVDGLFSAKHTLGCPCGRYVSGEDIEPVLRGYISDVIPGVP